MHSLIQSLVELQDILRAIGEAERCQRQVPERHQALERQLEEAASELRATQEELAVSQKNRRKLEMDVASTEELVHRHQDQLMTVKTNEAYRALQHEIDGERSKIRGLEDQILDLMERGEKLAERIKSLEEKHAGESTRVAEQKRQTAEEGETASRECERLVRRRAALESSLPADRLEHFHRIARARGGVAIVQARNELCGGCNVRLRPQVFQEIRRGETLHCCGSCKRFLYWPGEGDAGGGAGAEPRTEEGHAPPGS
ncbi:MAG: hypothetical protein V3U98_02605 [Acidobacteriota bacterium]